MDERPILDGVLETVLYCDASNESDTRRFYEEVLGLRRLPAGFAYRTPAGHLFLLFNADESGAQDDPPPHGARGPGHTCFTCAPDAYEAWKAFLSERGVEVTREIEWPNGARSFYFEDPAGNVLEIADGDLWPR